MSDQKAQVVVNALGHRCPVPTLKLQKALERAAPGVIVQLLADDPMAKVDVPHFAAAAGHELVSSEMNGNALTFLLRKKS